MTAAVISDLFEKELSRSYLLYFFHINHDPGQTQKKTSNYNYSSITH